MLPRVPLASLVGRSAARGATSVLASSLTGAAAPAGARLMGSAPLDGPAPGTAPAAPRNAGPRPPTPSLALDDLRDNPGATKVAKRKGRGEGSGMGKTAGRGMKGTTARQGGSVALGFEGGQSPLWRRTPKIGFINKPFKEPLEPVNLDKLQLWIDQGRIDASKRITMRTLLDSGLVSGIEFGVKLLATGPTAFTAKVDIEVSQASAGAIAAVEAAGGRVVSGAWAAGGCGVGGAPGEGKLCGCCRPRALRQSSRCSGAPGACWLLAHSRLTPPI